MNNLKTSTSFLKPLSLLGLLLFFVGSCIKDEINLDKISTAFETGLIVPIAYGELTIADLINSQDSDKVVHQYPDGMLYILYKKDIFSKDATDFIQLPTPEFIDTIDAAGLGLAAVPSNSPAVTKSVPLDKAFQVLNNEELDSLVVKSGVLNIHITSSFKKTGTLGITIPDLIKPNGNAVQFNVPISKNNGTFDSIVSADITGCKLKFRTKSGMNNLVTTVFNFNLAFGGSVSLTDRFVCATTVQNFSYSQLYGYLGQRELFNEAGKIGMKIFDIASDSAIKFKNPILRIKTCNSFGIPFGVKLYDMKTFNENNDSVVLSIPTDYTYGMAPSIHVCKDSIVQYDKNNSNIAVAIASVPKYLNYGMIANTNPSGKTKNFVTDTSTLKASVEVELPMELIADKYEFIDTFDFPIGSDIKDFSILKQLMIYNDIENWFPFEAGVQLLFTDSVYNPIDTAYTIDKPIVVAGILDGNNKVVSPGIYNKPITITGERILKYKKVNKALLKVEINTKDYLTKRYVKFYITDKIKIHLGMKIDCKANSFDQL